MTFRPTSYWDSLPPPKGVLGEMTDEEAYNLEKWITTMIHPTIYGDPDWIDWYWYFLANPKPVYLFFDKNIDPRPKASRRGICVPAEFTAPGEPKAHIIYQRSSSGMDVCDTVVLGYSSWEIASMTFPTRLMSIKSLGSKMGSRIEVGSSISDVPEFGPWDRDEAKYSNRLVTELGCNTRSGDNILVEWMVLKIEEVSVSDTRDLTEEIHTFFDIVSHKSIVRDEEINPIRAFKVSLDRTRGVDFSDRELMRCFNTISKARSANYTNDIFPSRVMSDIPYILDEQDGGYDYICYNTALKGYAYIGLSAKRRPLPATIFEIRSGIDGDVKLASPERGYLGKSNIERYGIATRDTYFPGLIKFTNSKRYYFMDGWNFSLSNHPGSRNPFFWRYYFNDVNMGVVGMAPDWDEAVEDEDSGANCYLIDEVLTGQDKVDVGNTSDAPCNLKIPKSGIAA